LYALKVYGPERLDIVAAFAVSGLTVGVAGGALYLFLKYIFTKHDVTNIHDGNTDTRRSRDITREIITISLPIMISSSFVSLSGMIDSYIMKLRLTDLGELPEIAKKIYGDYSGMAMPFFSLPNTLVVPFAVTIIPVIAEAFNEKNLNSVKSTIESTFRVSSMVAMPCAFGIACMSKPILNLIFAKSEESTLAVETTAPMLSVLAIAIIFVSMMTVTNSMLQAQKQEWKTIISMLCGMVVKIVSSYFLMGIPLIGKYGTPIGTCLCYMTIMSINFYFLAKYTKVVPPIGRTFVKPFMSSAIMAICTITVYMLLNNLLNGSKIAVLIALVFAVVIYFTFIIIFKTLTREDVLLLPKGAQLYEVMKKKKLIN